MDTLTRNRQAIDDIDRQLIQLLARRMQAVADIAAFKGDNSDAPLYDGERERAVFDRWAAEGAKFGVPGYFLGRVLREILSWSRRNQERHTGRPQVETPTAPVRVGYQGASASYSDLAREKLFASRPEGESKGEGYESFGAAADALEAEDIDYALLPIENTIAGSIHEVYGLLASRNLVVVDEEVWHVEHALAAKPGTRIEDVTRVLSHPVALQQCGRFLGELSDVHAEAYYDTAASAACVAEGSDPGVAAICSIEAARLAGLTVLKEHVADQRTNITRFLLIAREAEAVDPRLAAKTSLLLTVNHRQGALAECLAAFAREDLNLTKLESRPCPEAPWEYLFYVDVEGSTADPRLEAALAALEGFTRSVRVLGSYPSRTAQGPAPDARSHAVAAEPEAAPASLPALTLAGPERRPVRVGAIDVGGSRFTLIAGPGEIGGRKEVLAAAHMARERGAAILRGGAPEGIGPAQLELLAEAGAAYELPIVTEVRRAEDVDRFAERVDVLQVGARSMHNFELLRALGRVRRPVLIERGLSATIDELLQSAEAVLNGGNQQVILCERGIRTFETSTRNTLDLSAVPVLKERTHLPVIVDPSHAAGRRELVLPLALAAAAAGADGLLIEAYPDGGRQALTGDDLTTLTGALEPIVRAQGRTL
ncbi:MAG: hypothetical protein GY711_23705 [bacterium]|nr:hypothetical protein [bacterium]